MTLLKQRNKSGEAFIESEEILRREDGKLAQAIIKLRQHNKRLTRRMQLRPHVRVIDYSLASATQLALWHCSGFQTGRKAAYTLGLSERSWYYGRALLMVARLHDGREFRTNDPAQIVARLNTAVEKYEKEPQVLYARVPKSRRPRGQ